MVALIISSFAFAQEQSTTDKITSLFSFLEKSVAAIEKQYAKLEKQLQKQEERLRKKLAKKDSLAAAQLFASSTAKYQQLQNQIKILLASINNDV